MEYLYGIIAILAAVGFVVYMNRKAKAEQAVRDAAFEATMRALEQKAKDEGTFVMSYFDKSAK